MVRIVVVPGVSAVLQQRMEAPWGVGVVPWRCGRCREIVGVVNADRARYDARVGYEELCEACMVVVAGEEGDDR